MVPNIGLNLESKEDNEDDSENKVTDWGLIFTLLKQRGFSHDEILNLSYPQFNAYMNQINNPLSYNVVVPYMGSSEDENDNQAQIASKEELLSLVADMNKEFV